MNQILKKLAIKSQENMKKSKDEMTRWFWQTGPDLANSNHNNRTSSESERPLSNLGEDEKLKEMIYSIYNYVSAQKDREVGDAPRWNISN